jgi:hypothetical protein
MFEPHVCAFTNCCTNPGPRARFADTNRYYCGPHLRAMTLPSNGGSSAGELAGTRSDVHEPRTVSRQRWSLGIATTGSWI